MLPQGAPGLAMEQFPDLLEAHQEEVPVDQKGGRPGAAEHPAEFYDGPQ